MRAHPKRTGLLLVVGLGLLFVCSAQAQPLALDATLVSNGAGVLSGGPLSVELAVGQPAVGEVTGGTLQVDLGFFAGGNVAGVGVADAGLPARFALDANYPNPVTRSTTITYTLAEPSDVRLDVFDVLGRRVRTLVAEAQGPGRYTVPFTASSLAGGVYLYRLAAGTPVATRSMQIVR